MTSRRKLAFIWLTWFAALNVLWLIFISAWVTEEEILGLVGSAVGATAAVAVHAQQFVQFEPRPRWFLHAFRLPGRAITQSAFVLTALVRRLAGRDDVKGNFRTIPVTMPDDPAESAAKRAMLIIGESFPPNGYVLGIDEDRGLMLIHEIVREDRG